MSARKIRNRWWVDFRHEGKRYRKKSPDNSRAGAGAYERLLHKRLSETGSLESTIVVGQESFAAFADRWFDTYVIVNNRLSEQRSKRTILARHLLPFFSKKCLSEITPKLIEQFKARQVKTGLAAKTVNNHLTVLGRALTLAEEWGDLQHRPRIRHLKVPPQAFDYLTPQESKLLLKGTGDPLWHGAILLALRTGLRLGELLGLEWRDLDLEKRLLTVRQALVRRRIGPPKSNRIRHIPLSGEVQIAFSSWPHKTGFVFGPDQGSRTSCSDVFARVLRTACKTAGLRHFGWHTLRHTFASQLVASGVHLKVIQEMLGHTDIRVTMRYAHLDPENLVDAVNRLDGLASSDCGQRVGNAEFDKQKSPMKWG